MPIHALLTTVWALPKPTVLSVLDSLEEELANLVGSGLGVTVLAQDDFIELLLVPLVHGIVLLLVVLVSDVSVEVLLLRFATGVERVAKLALGSLVTSTCLPEGTGDTLGIDTKRHLGLYDGEQWVIGNHLGGFGSSLLLLGLALLLGELLLALACSLLLLLDERYLLLTLASLLVLHTERLFEDRTERQTDLEYLCKHGCDVMERTLSTATLDPPPPLSFPLFFGGMLAYYASVCVAMRGAVLMQPVCCDGLLGDAMDAVGDRSRIGRYVCGPPSAPLA